jgi:hypothetical protein
LTPASPGAGGDPLEAGSEVTGGPKQGARLWPILITLGLVFVILVNAIFIYIAVSGADEVVPSYLTEER